MNRGIFLCEGVILYSTQFFCLLNVIVYVVITMILSSSFGNINFQLEVSFKNILLSVLKVFLLANAI